MKNIFEFLRGLKIKPTTPTAVSAAGEMEVLSSSSNKLNYHNGVTASPMVTEAHTATLSNKTLTTPVIDEIITSTNTDLNLNPNGTGRVKSQKAINIGETTTPSTPASGYGSVYFKSDGKLYQLNDDGVEQPMGFGAWKEQVAIAAQSNIPLTGSTPLTIYGVTLTNGTRILLTAQSSAPANGIYTYSDNGSTYTLSRSSDADTGAKLAGAVVLAQLSSSTGFGVGYIWVVANDVITLGVTNVAAFTISEAENITYIPATPSDWPSAPNLISEALDELAANLGISDNITISGNTISSTNTNGDINISPNGTGRVHATKVLDLPEISTPATPASGFGSIYFKSDNKAYTKNDAGTETVIGDTISGITALTGDVTATGPGSVAATIGTNKVVDTMIRQSAGLSVIGRSANTTGNVADVTAASDNQVLRRSGTSIGFGAIDLSQSNTVSTSVLGVANGGTGASTLTANNVILGNSTSAVQFVAPGTSGNVLTSNGTTWTSSSVASGGLSVVSKSGTYTADPADGVILCDASSGAFTINLYTASGNSGRTLRIKKTDSSANAVTVDGNSTETIDGFLTLALFQQQQTLTIVSDGTNWKAIGPVKFRISQFLASGTRVTGSAPTAIGEYRTYLRNANAQTYTETNGAPGTSPSAANGMLLYGPNAWNTADSNNEPSRYEVFVGKYRNLTWELYSATGRTGSVSLNCYFGIAPTGSTTVDGSDRQYDPATGIASIVIPMKSQITNQGNFGVDSTLITEIKDGYFDIIVGYE